MNNIFDNLYTIYKQRINKDELNESQYKYIFNALNNDDIIHERISKDEYRYVYKHISKKRKVKLYIIKNHVIMQLI